MPINFRIAALWKTISKSKSSSSPIVSEGFTKLEKLESSPSADRFDEDTLLLSSMFWLRPYRDEDACCAGFSDFLVGGFCNTGVFEKIKTPSRW